MQFYSIAIPIKYQNDVKVERLLPKICKWERLSTEKEWILYGLEIPLNVSRNDTMKYELTLYKKLPPGTNIHKDGVKITVPEIEDPNKKTWQNDTQILIDSLKNPELINEALNIPKHIVFTKSNN